MNTLCAAIEDTIPPCQCAFYMCQKERPVRCCSLCSTTVEHTDLHHPWTPPESDVTLLNPSATSKVRATPDSVADGKDTKINVPHVVVSIHVSWSLCEILWSQDNLNDRQDDSGNQACWVQQDLQDRCFLNLKATPMLSSTTNQNMTWHVSLACQALDIGACSLMWIFRLRVLHKIDSIVIL